MFTVKTSIDQFSKNNSDKKYKVLLNAGGGCFGYIISKFMSSLDFDLYSKIDVAGGTSICGILAIIYSINKDYNEVKDVFNSATHKIFKKKCLGGIRGPMYCNEQLKRFIQKFVSDYKLSDIKKINERDLYLIIPTLDFNLTLPRVFDNINLDPQLDIELWKIALATAAAPTYFSAQEYEWKINNINKEELEARPVNEQLYLLTKQMLEYQDQQRMMLQDISYKQDKSVLIDGGVIENIPCITTYTALRSELGVKPSQIDMFVLGTGNDVSIKSTTVKDIEKWSYLDWLTKFLVPYVTCSNELTSVYWGAQMGFNSFCFYNPVQVSGAMDDPKIISKLDKDTQPFIEDFKKEIDQFINK